MAQSSAAWSFVAIAALTMAAGGACAGDTSPTGTAPPASSAPTPDAESPATDGPQGVVNYTRIDATVASAGATPPEAMVELKALGFASVINFRTPGERGATVEESRMAAEAAGLRYVHLPFREATPEVAERFLDVVSDAANQPVYIHDGSANRVGAMWLIKRVRADGWSVEAALTEAEAIGLRSESLKAFALNYVEAGDA